MPNPTTTLPLHIDLEIQRYGVVLLRAKRVVAKPSFTFRAPNFDPHGEPEF